MESFKVGDKVRILEGTKQIDWNSDGKMEKYIGTKGVITKILSSEPKYRVVCDLDSDFWFFNKEDLEKVENMDKMKEFTKSDLKVGYVVEITDKENGSKFLMKVENGKNDICLSSPKEWFPIKSLSSDMERDTNTKHLITRVYGFATNDSAWKLSIDDREVIWERIEKSPFQIELESLEQQQREIADKIAELSKKCN